jgi:DNA helicase-2/ATP-dependent DNA helicase PcrA
LKSGVKPSRNPPISASTISLSLYDPETGFQAGDRVQHHVFGEGVILGFSGSGDHTTVEVDFREIGQKTLLVRYANLKKL